VFMYTSAHDRIRFTTSAAVPAFPHGF
jgi:hypothetical protein